ncbi:MAG: hypothetical protein LBD37_04195 [Treponema sp.]|jgi:hypothetical protein|nr:hypothetical protein [Treponema sp.]
MKTATKLLKTRSLWLRAIAMGAVIAIGLAACGGGGKAALVGTWTANNGVQLILAEDGTGRDFAENSWDRPVIWTVENGVLTVSKLDEDGDIYVTLSGKYKISGKNITWTWDDGGFWTGTKE